jgi:flagellar biosynthesis/type III secretory pathway chaperone
MSKEIIKNKVRESLLDRLREVNKTMQKVKAQNQKNDIILKRYW